MNKIFFRKAFVAIALSSSALLAACSGIQHGVLPDAAQRMHPQGVRSIAGPGTGANSGVCSTYTGLDCKNNPPIDNPGPIPGENSCDPTDNCGGGHTCLSNRSNCVATANPEVGEDCDGSQAHGTPIKLGTSNLPGGTNGKATSVVNIWSVQSQNFYVAGWAYKTENGQYFWEGNANAMPLVNQLAGSLPFVGGAIPGFLDMVNNPSPVSASELDRIIKASSTGTFHRHECFSHDLPASSLG